MNQKEQKYLDKLLIYYFLSCRIPYRVSDHDTFKRFVNRLNPLYSIPKRTKLSTKLLNEIFIEARQRSIDAIKKLPYFTVALDGWKDISSNSIYGIMALYED